jgi:hypothetical protein
MSLENEMNDIANEKVSRFIDEAGVYSLQIKGFKTSEDDQKYIGKPFFEFEVEEVGTAKKANIRFYRTTKDDKEEVQKYKRAAIKSFLENADANFTLKGIDMLKSVIGKKVKALFKKEEFIGKDKDQNNMPVIKESVKYSFSKPINEEITGTQNYLYKRLSPADIEKYNEQLKDWKKHNQSASATPTTGGAEPGLPIDDDMPF